MSPPPKRLTVLVDSREKFPLLFPASVLWYPTRAARPFYIIHIDQKVVELPAGDYALKGYEHTCIIERKGAMTELMTNLCSKDYARSHAAYQRLVDTTAHPYLMLEETPAGMLPNSYPSTRPVPDRVVDAFLREVCGFKIPLIFAGRARSPGHRRKLGHFMLKIMLGHALQTTVDFASPPA